MLQWDEYQNDAFSRLVYIYMLEKSPGSRVNIFENRKQCDSGAE